MITLNKKENLNPIVICLFLFVFQIAKIIYSTDLNPPNFLSSINNMYSNTFLGMGFIILLTVLTMEYLCQFSNCRNYKSYKRYLIYLLGLILLDLIYCIIIFGYTIFTGYKFNISLNEILYYLKPVLIYHISILILFNSVGLLITQFITNTENSKKPYFFSIFIIPFTLYMIQKKFQPTLNSLLPAIKLNSYFYTNITFILILGLSVFLLYVCISLIRSKNKLIILILCIFLSSSWLTYKSFKICKSYSPIEISTYSNSSNTNMVTDSVMITNINMSNDYTVTDYYMDIELKENFHNKCVMNVVRNANYVTKLKFNFFCNNKIENLTVNNINAKFSSDASTLYIEVPKEITTNELSISLDYSSYIYTYDHFDSSDFLTEDIGYLSPYFSWYPRLNDEPKNFNITINGCNKDILSNLNVQKESNSYKCTGNMPNIYLYYDDISKTQYDNYTIIGSNYLIHDTNFIKYLTYDFNAKKTDDTFKSFNDIKTIILVPHSISSYFFIDKNTIVYPIRY